jgi:hypothetical protein
MEIDLPEGNCHRAKPHTVEELQLDYRTRLTNHQEMRYAKIFADSGLFPDVQNYSQGIVKIMAGRELGLTPLESINTIYITKGKIGVETKVFLAAIKKSKKYDYSVEFEYGENPTNKRKYLKEARVTIYQIYKDTKEPLGTASFSAQDVVTIGKDKSAVYASYPDLMYFYRAASKAIRLYCPDILQGLCASEDLADIETIATPPKQTVNINELIKEDKTNDNGN